MRPAPLAGVNRVAVSDATTNTAIATVGHAVLYDGGLLDSASRDDHFMSIDFDRPSRGARLYITRAAASCA